jgi:hypothetical protein
MITRANALFEFVAWMQHQELRVLISFITSLFSLFFLFFLFLIFDHWVFLYRSE